jgi:hypothetical protein
VASYASLVGSDNAIKVPKGYRNTDQYLQAVYDWEKKQGDDRTTNFDGSARKATGDVEPVISQKLLEQGYTWQPTGTAYGELDGNRFGGGGGGEKNYPMKRPQVREWTLTKFSGGNSQASSSAQAPAAKQDTPQAAARFEPSPGLTNTATAIEALERAEEYQKQADAAKDAANPSPFRKSGDGLYASISDIGTRALDYYTRFDKPLAEQRAMLGIQEVGESLGFNAKRLRSDIKLPETMGIDDTLEYVKRFQGLIG